MVIEMVSNDLALEHLSQGQYEIGYQTNKIGVVYKIKGQYVLRGEAFNTFCQELESVIIFRRIICSPVSSNGTSMTSLARRSRQLRSDRNLGVLAPVST